MRWFLSLVHETLHAYAALQSVSLVNVRLCSSLGRFAFSSPLLLLNFVKPVDAIARIQRRGFRTHFILFGISVSTIPRSSFPAT